MQKIAIQSVPNLDPGLFLNTLTHLLSWESPFLAIVMCDSQTLKVDFLKKLQALLRITSNIICSANQWTGFDMIGSSIMKE